MNYVIINLNGDIICPCCGETYFYCFCDEEDLL
jgi:hypothetical protein